MNDSAALAGVCLRERYRDVASSTKIGGAEILGELGKLASSCVSGLSDAQDAVAFALSEIFARHSEDREERIVTGDDTYRLMASGAEVFSQAVDFIEVGGNSDDATRIIAALARLTPDRLYGGWPPSN
jgi:hypothetical protein